MARNEWTKWGRGDCEGYSLEIGGSYARFEASVVRGPSPNDAGQHSWSSSINGKDHKQHSSREEAMAHIEFELANCGECFVSMYQGYKAHRHKNKFSQAVDDALARRAK
jgi:hypothetical protein